MNSLGDRLHSLRKSKSLTQEAFAASLNERYDLKINKSMISKWENNIDTPSLNSVKYMAVFFDVSLDYLLGISDDSQDLPALDSSSSFSTMQLTDQEKHIISIYHDLDRVGQEKFTAFGEGLLAAARAKDSRGYYTFTPYENYMVAESGPEYQMWSNKVNDQLMEDADRIAKKEIENASDTKKMVK